MKPKINPQKLQDAIWIVTNQNGDIVDFDGYSDNDAFIDVAPEEKMKP